MTPEPQRLQYLEAMGVTAWVARYQLPNARPSETCEWELPEPGDTSPPAERLHALIDEVAPAVRPSTSAASVAPPPAAGRVRQLLGMTVAEGKESTEQDVAPAADTSPMASQEPLRFSLQVACLEGRWLVLLPGLAAVSEENVRLLCNLLAAAGITTHDGPDFHWLRWPPVEGLAVNDPLEEAADGLRAFIAGAARQAWSPERVLVFGRHELIDPLLGLSAGRCELLELPGWQGPSLDVLAASAEAKRALWPTLLEWRRTWRGEAG
ncbi:hypothetical protein [Halomonas sp. E14]|uniref:hypothetical protein n=1 Tax=Halomonas sp. E14 TaxID=3397245 RepID=UPI00403E6D38